MQEPLHHRPRSSRAAFLVSDDGAHPLSVGSMTMALPCLPCARGLEDPDPIWRSPLPLSGCCVPRPAWVPSPSVVRAWCAPALRLHPPSAAHCPSMLLMVDGHGLGGAARRAEARALPCCRIPFVSGDSSSSNAVAID
ncbi:hypothetical protein ZWY2020_002779 [Hordeum vulgare]|nr:hypothetical protein ZWY2020_002779 [Hordeum vulgare]